MAGVRMGQTLRQLCGWIGRFAGRRARRAGREVDLSPEPSLVPEAVAAPAASTILANHELLRPIGQGAYGEVWLARDEIGVYHAVKLIHKKTFPDRNPFEREYRGILQYTPISRTHHGLVPILHVGRDNAAGYFYYVMELADCVHAGRVTMPESYCARTLAHELDTRGRLRIRECLQLGLELTEALGYLHSRQLIHRDIKPANIIFVNGMAKLADVGLVTHMAEAGRDPKHLGTEGFTPPEGPGTAWADVYSLGKVLCEASLGRDADGMPLSLEPLVEDPDAAEFHAVVEIFRTACHEELAQRHQSIEEMQRALMQLHDGFHGVS